MFRACLTTVVLHNPDGPVGFVQMATLRAMSGVTCDTERGWRAAVADLGVDVDRVADRLRSLSQARLAAPLPPHESRAAAGRALAQLLAEVAQGVEEGASGPPSWRVVPALGDFAVGDQVSVTGHDAVAALSGSGSGAPGWDRSGRAGVDVLLARAARAVGELRRSL
jgi:hypothetical protein